MSSTSTTPRRRRMSADERREAIVEAAVHEFAHGGLHGTPVDRIARAVGVAQPYVFSLFSSKRELFLAAVARGFATIGEVFTQAAAAYDPALAEEGSDMLSAMGTAYVEMLERDRDQLMLQHQAYAACDDPVVRDRVRAHYAELVNLVQRLSGALPERIDQFFSYGMWLNVAAAMGVPDLKAGCEWMLAEAGGPPAAAG
jgi:AcrR family transcriptional regulator